MNATVNQLNQDKIQTLREGFASIERVSPDRLSDFHKIFDAMSDEQLLAMSKAGIKFVSKLALNACIRRNLIKTNYSQN